MNKRELILLIFLLIGKLVSGQDIRPNVQADGYMNNKNINMDKATGKFCYTVPLCELTSEGYNLPVSLQYVSNGVKYNDKPGIIGYNWTLQTGGIVSRVIRGGIADETFDVGYAFNEEKKNSLLEDEEKVNSYKRDGEADLFTVSFGEENLTFVLKWDKDKFIAIPLEPTRVKIDCEYSKPDITGWSITDANGVKYIYRVTARVKDYSYETYVGLYDFRAKNYISSWYLSKIEIPNGDTFYFHYNENTPFGESDKEIEKTIDQYQINEQIIRCYDAGMIYSPLEIYPNTYEYIRILLGDLKNVLINGRLEAHYRSLQREVDKMQKAMNNGNLYKEHKAICGLFAPAIEREYPVLALSQYIAALETPGNIPWPNAAFPIFMKIKRAIREALKPQRILEEASSQKNSYDTEVPLLRRISNTEKDIIFNYKDNVLQDIYMKDYKHDNIQRIRLHVSKGLLKGINWQGASLEYQRQSFTYYLDTLKAIGHDQWGYYNGQVREPNDKLLIGSRQFSPRWYLDTLYCKAFSLKDIILPKGGCIEVDYESNKSNVSFSYIPKGLFGGIRVKSITLKEEGETDVIIKYSYPHAGSLMYKKVIDSDTIDYSGKHDIVWRESVVQRGNVYINMGNNGLFYYHVLEKMVGMGTTAYLFVNPYLWESDSLDVYRYWMNCLPLAQACYDESGYLVYQMRNEFEMVSLADPGMKDNKPSRYKEFGYNKFFDQLKVNPYYIDEYDTDSLFPSKDNNVSVLLYDFGGNDKLYYNQLHDFGLNIGQRMSPKVTNLHYRIVYGGQPLLLNSLSFYCFGRKEKRPKLIHLSTTAENSVCQAATYYEYDTTGNMLAPAHVTQQMANSTFQPGSGTSKEGDKIVTLIRRICDIAPGVDPVIDIARQENVQNLVVKKQTFSMKRGENKYRLISEIITLYKDTLNPAGKHVILPSEEYHLSYKGDILVDKLNQGIETKLFSCTRDRYKREKVIYYTLVGHRFLPGEIQEGQNRVINYFDQGRGNIILSAQACQQDNIAALYLYRKNMLDDPTIVPEGRKNVAGLNLPSTLSVKPKKSKGQYRLFMYVKSPAINMRVNYSVKNGSSNVNRTVDNLKFTGKGEWKLVMAEIDLSSFNHTDVLSVEIPAATIALATLTPLETTFSASSYDSSGRKFCQLNQLGQLERYEYDRANRLAGIYDVEGNLLKTYTYSRFQ